MPSAPDATHPTPRRGRPRDATRDDALRRATLEMLAEVGYRALTMDAVAARARAGKATIYRRWDSKGALVVDAFAREAQRSVPVPDTGSVAGDLREHLDATARLLAGPVGRAAQALVGELPHEPELAAAFRASFVTGQRCAVDAVLRRAAERGEIRSDAPVAAVAEITGAALTHRSMLSGQQLDGPFLDGLVDRVLLPLLRP
ncbi:MAG: TetR/AcrR family transcriptional regulator [Pseudonocardiaceae bacterium]